MNNKRINCGLVTLVFILSLFFYNARNCKGILYKAATCYNHQENIGSAYKQIESEAREVMKNTELLGNKSESFTLGKSYYGFELLESKQEDGELLLNFKHVKSGAKLFAVKNKDINKHFSIAFRTPVYDNKGAAHILEHCVLVGGSQKYPVKQLLKEVMESSLSKDMNGMTTSDTTIYPFSTTNEKEFVNIMDIYMDMVFHPLFYEDKRIFREEGWYYENSKDGLKYNGVVYNEMKGALSTADGRLYNSICKSLYPDTTYAFVSGGDPTYITDLTFDELKQFHEKYYHPSNSFLYLYGDMDISSKLKELNDNYLKNYESKGINSTIEKSSAHELAEAMEYTYAVEDASNLSNKSILTYNFSIDEKNASTDMALEMMDSLLISNPNSNVYKNLRDAGFNNVSGTYVTNLRENFYSIVAYNCNKEDEQKFIEAIEDSLLAAFINGIGRDIIDAELNKVDLSTRWYSSSSGGRGDEINRRILDRYVYGYNPMSAFVTEKDVSTIMESKENYYFEEILDKYFIRNEHKSIMILSPEKGLAERIEKREKEKIQTFASSLKSGEYETLINSISELRVWQNSRSDDEYIDRIPKLKMEDVNPVLDLLPACKRKEDDIEVIYHPWETNETCKMNMYFNIQNVKQEDLCYVRLLTNLLGKVNTANMSANQLESRVNSVSRGINYTVDTFTDEKDSDKVSAYIKASFLTKDINIKDMMEIVNQEMLYSQFNDKDILKSYLNNISLQNETIGNRCPEVISMNRNMACYYKEKALSEYFYGVSYVEFIKNLYDNIDKDYDKILKKLSQVSNEIFNKKNVVISVTTDDKGYNEFKKSLNNLTKNMKKENAHEESWKFPLENKCEAMPSDSEVLYNTQGFNYKKLGYKYNGNMKVMKNILELDYLWDKVRVEGGAYGVNVLMNSKGVMAMTSFRDPKMLETFKVYEGIPRYLHKLNMTTKELESYKISSLAEYCTTKSLDEKVAYADHMYFSNIKSSDLEKELWEIKTTTLNDIKSYKNMFEKGLSEKSITVAGNRKEIIRNKNIFDNIK